MARQAQLWAPHSYRSPSLRVAVVVNEQALRVNASIIRRLKEMLGREQLYLFSERDHFALIARQIVLGGFDVVLCGGGDGTFCRCVTDILRLRPRRAPAFGLLPLGTGNALASTLGAFGLSAHELHLAQEPERQIDLTLLRVGDTLAPFAGLGADAMILEDYNRFRITTLGALTRGALGYALTVATRSLWRLLLRSRVQVAIRNAGADAHRLDAEARPVGDPIPRGDLLYRGPCIMAAASTIEHYGFGLRLFPQAHRLNDRFQLRIINTSVLSILLRMGAFLSGDLHDARIHDFSCSAVSIQTTVPAPFQIGGDEAGRRGTVRLRLSRIRAVRGTAVR